MYPVIYGITTATSDKKKRTSLEPVCSRYNDYMRWRAFTIEYFLVSLIIFTIPFNWFLKGETDSAFLRGIQIDYLLLKLYLQDILLLCLGIYLLYSYRSSISQWLARNAASIKRAAQAQPNTWALTIRRVQISSFINCHLPLSLMGLILVTGFKSLAVNQLSTYMSMWQLISATGFAYHLHKRFTYKQLVSFIWKPLALSALMQACIALYQFIQQKSILGYILFGEINLSLPGSIARESVLGVMRVLPYGTLPHPNVLAGFLGLVILIALVNFSNLKRLGLKTSLHYIFLGLLFLVILLTHSWLAIAGIVLLFFVILFSSKYKYFLLICLYVIINLTYVLLPKWLNYQSKELVSNYSIIRRVKLMEAGQKVLADHFWFGTGFNQSLHPMHTTYASTSPAEFMQPIHSIYMLWTVETGVVGAALLGVVLLSALASPKKHTLVFSPAKSIKRPHPRESRTLRLRHLEHVDLSVDRHGDPCGIKHILKRFLGKLGMTILPIEYQSKTRDAYLKPALLPLFFLLWVGSFDHYLLTLRQGQLMLALGLSLATSLHKGDQKTRI